MVIIIIIFLYGLICGGYCPEFQFMYSEWIKFYILESHW